MTDSSTVAVTGAAGYVGSRVVADLAAAHPEWDLLASDNWTESERRSVGGVEIDLADVRVRADLDTALDGADVVVHCAAVTGVGACADNPGTAFDVNVLGTATVADWCRRHDAALVYPGSVAAFGPPRLHPIDATHARAPTNWYGRTKHVGEALVDTMGIDAIQLLKTNVYGYHTIDGERVSKPSVVNLFVDRATAGKGLAVHEPGTQTRNFVHVADASRAYLRAVEALLARIPQADMGLVSYLVGGPGDASVREVASMVSDAVGGVPVETVANPRPDDPAPEHFVVDTSRAQAALDWSPEWTLREGIEAMVREVGDGR